MSKYKKSKKNKGIYYYFLKNGEKRWMYRHKYYDSLGKRKEKKKSGFKTEREALKSLLELKASILSGQTNHIDNSEMTVSQWMDIWFETKKRTWKVSTQRINKNAIRHIKRLIGNYKISKLTSNTYEREFINKLYEEGYKPKTIQGLHTTFKMAINYAVNEEIIFKNRFVNIKIKQDERIDNFLSPEELQILLNEAKRYGNPTEYTFILLLAYSGIRRGEALGLFWKNVDFENNTITIEHTRDYQGIRSPKTKNSYRTIDIDEKVMVQLKKYYKECKKIKLANGTVLDENKDLVFITPNYIDGIYPTYIDKFLNKLYNILYSKDIKIKKINLHGLRHTHATILIDQLVPIPDIAERLGNTIEMIYRVYAHSIRKSNKKIVRAFSEGVSYGAKSGAK